MATKADQHSNYKEDWETPQWLFDYYDRRYGFQVDLAAEAHNAKCPVFLSPAINSLLQDWNQWRRAWLNPPFGKDNMVAFLTKVIEARKLGLLTVVVLPASTDTHWFQDFVFEEADRIEFIRTRVQFEVPLGMEEKARNTGGTAVAIYYPPLVRP